MTTGMNIIKIIPFALLVCTWISTWIQFNEAIAVTKPNILFIVIDDLGWNDTSYKGSDIQTPTIDRFAKEGIRLQQYYTFRDYAHPPDPP